MKGLVDFINEGLINEAIITLETPFEKLCKYTDTDPNKEVWVLTRHVKNNFMKLKHFKNGEEASAFIDTLRNGKSEDGYYQGMSNDEEKLKKLMKLQTFRKYKKIFESCGGSEHKIVKDAAGNWRIKGTPGKGTNTDKEGLWAAKYDTEEDAKKALAAYHMHKNG